MTNKIYIISIIIIVNLKFINLLLFPQFTVLQITASFSAPVVIPDRKIFFDWGFQMNYDLPYNLSNFYNVPIWPGHSSKRSIIDDDFYKKYDPNFTTNPYDLSAGEFYGALEDILLSFGYHETCLLKSVCELAKHPFDLERENLLAEIITFVLSPSLHDAFGNNELEYKKAYETAEKFGQTGGDCDILYPECPSDVLNRITNVIFEH